MAETELERLRAALEMSVRLQSQYASLLNQHDGGKRMIFCNAGHFLERLEELGAKIEEAASSYERGE